MLFEIFFLLISCVSFIFYITSTSKTTVRYPNGLRAFEFKYFIIYLLAVAADWLQGPHIYTLYLSYGFSKHDIELLFAFGFGSSMITGIFIGIVSDKRGRRINCMFYGVFCISSCLLLHSRNFYFLLLGRVFSGIGTSILFSSFESWLVCEYNQHRFDVSFLPVIFCHLSMGNCVTAVISGVIAQVFADVFGLLSPFDLSAFLLVIMCVLIPLLWSENYGSQSRGLTSSFRNALENSSVNIVCLGIVQSLFESAMYSFVLQWTPMLRDAAEGTGMSLPYGVIFSTFMVAVSIGSSLFNFLQKKSPCLSFLRYFLLISSFSLLLPVFFPNNIYIIYLGFIIFEMTVGVFWPSVSTLRSKMIPENIRSTVMNIFRIPLNIFVIYILCQDFNGTEILLISVVLLFSSSVFHCVITCTN